MPVNHRDISERLGLSRSTVTKILNQLPNNRASAETVRKVFQTAREMGYDFSRLRNIHRRRAIRKAVSLDVRIRIIMPDGAMYDAGTATAINLNHFGALLTAIETARMSLPLSPFGIEIEFLRPPLEGVRVDSQVVRLISRKSVEIGVNFTRMRPSFEEKIVEFLNAEEEAP